MEYPMENRSRRHSRLSVGVGLFLTCLVLTTIIGLFGGQGSINVNSWAPDSKRFAYVRYEKK